MDTDDEEEEDTDSDSDFLQDSHLHVKKLILEEKKKTRQKARERNNHDKLTANIENIKYKINQQKLQLHKLSLDIDRHESPLVDEATSLVWVLKSS